jgi:hypothetical protein
MVEAEHSQVKMAANRIEKNLLSPRTRHAKREFCVGRAFAVIERFNEHRHLECAKIADKFLVR